MTLLITSLSIAIAAVLFVFIPKLYEHHNKIEVHGHTEPGFEEISKAFKYNFDKGLESMGGASFAAFYDGKLIADLWGGHANIKGGKSSLFTRIFGGRKRNSFNQDYDYFWLQDTLANTLSMTKGVVTIVIGHLQDAGKLNISDPIVKYWPQFGVHDKGNITISQLLSHTAGLPYIDPKDPVTFQILKDNTLNSDSNSLKGLDTELSRILAKQKPAWTPGTKRGYHVFTFGLYLDQIVRRCDTPRRRSLARYFEDEIAKKFDLDYFIGLPARDLNSRVAIMRNEPYLKSFTGMYQKFRFGFMVYTHPMTKKAMMNPDFVVKTQSMALNRPEIRALQFPSVIGIGNARSLAKIYGILANDGKFEGQSLLRPETIKELSKATSSPCDKDLIFGDMYKFAMATGFILIPNPDGKWNFGFPGHGLQLAFADPQRKLGYAYVTNTIANDQLNDHRGHNIVLALYKALNASLGNLKLPAESILVQKSDAFKDNLKLAIEREKDGAGLGIHGGPNVEPHLHEQLQEIYVKEPSPSTLKEESSLLASLWNMFGGQTGSKSARDKYAEPESVHHIDKIRALDNLVQPTIINLAKSLHSAKTASDIVDALKIARKQLSVDPSRFADLKDVDPSYFISKPYLEEASAMVMEATHKLKSSEFTDTQKHNILDLALRYILGNEKFTGKTHLNGSPGDKALTSNFLKLKDEILESARGIKNSKSINDVHDIIKKLRLLYPSKEVASSKYYESKEYLQDTSAMVLDAANRLAKVGNEDAEAILNQAGQYITGARKYIPGMHQKGYFEIAGDQLSEMFGHLYPHHKNGYFEKTRDVILESALALHGAKSAKDIKNTIDKARKSITLMSDQFINHKVPEAYYDSKEYIEDSAAMLKDAANKIAKSKNKDLHHLLDNTGQYLSGIKQYVPGMHQKGYFELFEDKLSDITDSISQAVHPHKKGYFKSAMDSLSDVKDGLVDVIYPHHEGYFDKTKKTILESAHKLRTAQSPNEIKTILESARKSIVSLSDGLSKHKMPQQYYDGKEYIQDTSAMLLDAANSLSKAGIEDTESILDQAGQYISGAKKYIPGMHQRGYFEIAGDKLSEMFGHLYPHHKKGYFEKTKDVILEAALALHGAKSAKDMKNTIDKARKSITSMSDQFINHKVPEAYYDSKEYIEDSAAMLKDAANKIAKSKNKDLHHLLDNTGQYLSGIKQYVPGMHQKGYFELFEDKLSDISDSISETVHPHKKGYFESAMDSLSDVKDGLIDVIYPHHEGYFDKTKKTILESAHKLRTAKSSNEIKTILESARKSIVSLSDGLSKHKMPQQYYDGKEYIQDTSAMLLDAANRLSKAGIEDTESILDQAGQYISGAKKYIPGMHQRGYFEIAGDKLSEMFGHLYPHHKKGYFEKTKDVILEAALALHGAKSAKDIKNTIDKARKSITLMSDQFINHKVPEAYYDSKEYIEDSAAMLKDAANKIAKSKNKDLHYLLDNTGQYLSGIKQYVPGMHQKGYFELFEDKLSDISDSISETVHPHKKGYFESAMDSLSDVKDGLIDVIYPHHEGYFDKTKKTILESAHKLRTAKSSNEIKTILESARKSIVFLSDGLSKHKMPQQYYDGKEYIQDTSAMLLDAANSLSKAGIEDTESILDQAGQYISGAKKYIPGMHQRGYFEIAGDKLSEMFGHLYPHHKKGYFEKTKDVILEAALALRGAKSAKDMKNTIDKARKSITLMSDQFINHKVPEAYYDSKEYIEDSAAMLKDAANKIAKSKNKDLHHLLDNTGQYLSGIKQYVPGMHQKGYFELFEDKLSDISDSISETVHPHKKGYFESAMDSLSDVKDGLIDVIYPHHEGYFDKTKKTILESAHKLRTAKSSNEIKTILESARKSIVSLSDGLSKHKMPQQYYDGKEYIQDTSAMLLDAANSLSKAGIEDTESILDQAGQYISGAKKYIPGMHQRGYFEIAGDKLSEMFGHLYPHHKKGYFERTRDVILEAALALHGAKSAKDMKNTIDKARKSITLMSDQFINHKVPEAYYDSKEYIEDSAAMLKDAANKIAKSKNKDLHHLLDNTGQYLSGIKQYVPGMHQKGYFEIAGDQLSEMFDHLYPHHKKGYFERTKDAILEAALSLHGAKSAKDMKNTIDKARKSITSMSDQFINHKVPEAYYDSKEYIEDSAAMLKDAANKIAKSKNKDLHHLLDNTGQYLSGIKQYVPGMHQKGYFEIAGDQLSEIFGHLYPHHKKGYFEKTRDVILEAALALHGAKSSKDIKNTIDKARKSITLMSDQFINHKVPEAYYDSKEYIEDSAAMLKDAANKMAKSKNKDLHHLLDNTGKYLSGIKQYVPGMHQKGYFELFEDKLSDISDSITEAVHPHKKDYFEGVSDLFSHTKDSILSSIPIYHRPTRHNFINDIKLSVYELMGDITELITHPFSRKPKNYYVPLITGIIGVAHKLKILPSSSSHDVKYLIDSVRDTFKEYLPSQHHKTIDERLRDGYYDSKAYLDASKAVLLEAAHELPRAGLEDAESILNQLGHSMLGLKGALIPRQHEPSYYEAAYTAVSDAVSKLGSAKATKSSPELAKEIIHQTRQNLLDASSYFRNMVIHHQKQEPLSHTLSHSYLHSKEYLDSSVRMLLEAASKHLLAAPRESHQTREILDQIGRYLIGFKDYASPEHYHQHKKSYFETVVPDKLIQLKDDAEGYLFPKKRNVLHNALLQVRDELSELGLYPHDKTYYEKARDIVNKAAADIHLTKSTSPEGIRSIIEKSRNSIIGASHHLSKLLANKNHHTFGDRVTDAYYDSKDYLEHTTKMLTEAAERLSKSGTEDAQHILEAMGKYLVGFTAYKPGKRGYFESTYDKLHNFVNPTKPTHWSHLKVGIHDLFYPHTATYYQRAREVILDTARNLETSSDTGKSFDDIKRLLDKARHSLITSSQYFNHLVTHPKHAETFGDRFSHAFYGSKEYVENNVAMILEAGKKLATVVKPEQAHSIMDQVGEYLVGVKDVAIGRPHDGYFDMTRDKLSHMLDWTHHKSKVGFLSGLLGSAFGYKRNVIWDLVFPHKRGYFERARHIILDTGAKLNDARSHTEIKDIVDNARKSLTSSSLYFTSLVKAKPKPLSERLTDSYYNSKSYVDATAAMLKEAAHRLPSAAAQDAYSIMDQTGQYIIGVKNYAVDQMINPPKSYFDLAKDNLGQFFGHFPHSMTTISLASRILDSITDVKNDVLNVFYPHPPTYYEKARDTITRSAKQLGEALTPTQKKSILEKARLSLSDASEHFSLDKLLPTMLNRKSHTTVTDKVAESYYDTVEYIESTGAIMVEAAKRLAHAGNEEAKAILDTTGQYVVGIKDFVSHPFHQNKKSSYRDLVWGKALNFLNYVYPPNKQTSSYFSFSRNDGLSGFFCNKFDDLLDTVIRVLPLPDHWKKERGNILQRFTRKLKYYGSLLHQ